MTEVRIASSQIDLQFHRLMYATIISLLAMQKKYNEKSTKWSNAFHNWQSTGPIIEIATKS